MKDSLSYAGKLKITIKYKDRILSCTEHNNGTPYLFKLFAKALAGYSVKDDLPYRLGVYLSSSNYEEELLSNKPILSTGIFFKGLYGMGESASSQGKDWMTQYTCMLKSSDFASGAISEPSDGQENSPAEHIVLHIDDKHDNALAKITLNEEGLAAYKLIKPGVVAIIEWTTCVSNPVDIHENTDGQVISVPVELYDFKDLTTEDAGIPWPTTTNSNSEEGE